MAELSNFISRSDKVSYESKFDTGRIHLAKIKDTRNFSRSGELKVWIMNSRIDEGDSSRWIVARYCSPFFGTTSPSRTYNQTFAERTKSYGWFACPPDVGNVVFIFFPNIQGENNTAYWFGCPIDPEQSTMIPGIPYNDDQVPAIEPTADVKDNTKDEQQLNSDRMPFDPLANALIKQGLDKDLLRGATSSGIKRESPSRVMGWLSPSGHSITLDDGWNQDDNLDNWDSTETSQLTENDITADLDVERYDSGIRIRTRDGVQILLSNNKGHIYMINKDGTAWAELNNDGYIDCWALKGVSASSEGDINLRAKRNINLHADNNVNIICGNEFKVESKNITEQAGENILSSAGANIESSAGTSIISSSGASIENKSPKIVDDGEDINLNGAVKVKTKIDSPEGNITKITASTVDSTNITGTLEGNVNGNITGSAGYASTAGSAPLGPAVPVSIVPNQPSIISPENPVAAGETKEIGKIKTQNVHTNLNNIITTNVSRQPSEEPYFYHLYNDKNESVQQPIVQQFKSVQLSNGGKIPKDTPLPTIININNPIDVPADLLPDQELIKLSKDDIYSVFEKSFQEVMLSEGGYVNDPNDPGGETKYGVSKRAYPNLDIKNLTLDQAREIYKRDYWDKCSCDNLPEGVAVMAADFAYNSGVSRAVKMLQRCCGTTETGKVNMDTMTRIQAETTETLMLNYKKTRLNFLQSLKTWSRYGRGWTKRVERNYSLAVAIDKMVNGSEEEA